jgi:oxygen-independent coproporphyrinogen III oxidase
MVMTPASRIDAIAHALEASPTIAYSAPHDYPHAAGNFTHRPEAPRPPVAADALRLYAHVPFCNYACSFCCYAKHVGAGRPEMERYVRALLRELEWAPAGTPLSQLFVGGGTPTALPADLLDALLAGIFTRLPPLAGPVHTVEASPESVSDQHLAVLRARGIGRISTGIQSLEAGVVEAVRREHGGVEAALDACRRIVAHGFILNIDLMYGLPGQTHETFRRDFERVAASGVHAVTAYNLRLNEHTPVARQLADGERLDLGRLLRWREHIAAVARDLGYTQTRWHTFKRLDGIAARHERLPTSGTDLRGYQLGIGLSARSSLDHVVYRNHRGRTTYVQRVEAGVSPVEELVELTPADRRTMYVARTLGDGKPLVLADYEATFGTRLPADFGGVLSRLLDGGLVEADGRAVELSADGRLLYDLVTLAFYPPPAKDWLLGRLARYQVA